MTTSPESTRPATRRALRERTRAQAETAAPGPLPAFGASLRPDQPHDAGDTETAVRPAYTDAGAWSADTVAVDVVEPAPGPEPDLDPADPAPSAPEPEPEPEPDLEDEFAEPRTAWADEKSLPTALTWIDETRFAESSIPEREKAPDLFAGAKLIPGWLRPRILVPLGIVAGVCGAYVATTLMWPLNAVAPVAATSKVEIEPAPIAAMNWPAQGSAAVGIQGIAPVASTTERDEIASISKVVSVLMVLDELPLEPGEQGPSFDFDWGDSNEYWEYRAADQSALDVPVGGSLTEYQMLQGIMLGSANNYIDRLSDELWGSDWGFSQASAKWLDDRGLGAIELDSPSGFDEDNIAAPAALLQLGELAMRNPVFAELAGTRSADIPGVGTVTNTNQMLDDPGVVGIKTGTLSHWNLLTAKDVPVGDTTVRLFASVLGQDDNEARLAVTRQLFAEVEASLIAQPIAVPKGTVVGHVTTEWGGRVDIVTDADAQVVLWNGATAEASTALTFEDESEAGAKVGTLTADGPLGTAETSVSLAEEIVSPSAWWRLTHPLELFGLDND